MKTRILRSFDRMPFGRFRGFTVSSVAEANPQYIMWAAANTEFGFTNGVVRRANQNQNNRLNHLY